MKRTWHLVIIGHSLVEAFTSKKRAHAYAKKQSKVLGMKTKIVKVKAVK